MSGPQSLAPPTRGQLDALRATLLHAGKEFPLYQEAFARARVTPGQVRTDPAAALAQLPVFDPAAVNQLATEALALRAHDLGGVELTSGTSGAAPKRRVLSEEDVHADAALVTSLMQLAGVRADDRVIAADLSVDPLPVAFLHGCERLGVREAVAVTVTARLDAEPLLRLDPTVLIAPPSLLSRLAPALTASAVTHVFGPRKDADFSFPEGKGARGLGPAGLRLVIYNGDKLYEHTAAAFRARGVRLRSLYGLTETSALGVECAVEQGIHLATTHALAEVRGGGAEQELVVTTLGFSMPLLRYPTGDLVRPLPGPCPCGSRWPRVAVLGRAGDRFSLFDVKFTPEEFQALLLEGPEESLQIVLDSGAGGRERLTFRLPASARPRERILRARLRTHPLLAYLLQNRLIEVRFAYHEPATVGSKLPALIDRRGRWGPEHGRG